MKKSLNLIIKYLQGHELSNKEIQIIYQNESLKFFFNDLKSENIKKYNLKKLLEISKEANFITSCCCYFFNKGYEYQEVKYCNLTIDLLKYILKVTDDEKERSKYKIFLSSCLVNKFKV